MVKPDKAVRDNTLYIAAVTAVFSMLMQAVFLVIGQWDLTVLWGNLLGWFTGVMNFFLLGLTVQAAVTKEEKQAKNLMKLSQTLRLFGVLLVIAIGVGIDRLFGVFNLVAMLIPLLFPRVAIALYTVFHRKEGKDS